MSSDDSRRRDEFNDIRERVKCYEMTEGVCGGRPRIPGWRFDVEHVLAACFAHTEDYLREGFEDGDGLADKVEKLLETIPELLEDIPRLLAAIDGLKARRSASDSVWEVNRRVLHDQLAEKDAELEEAAIEVARTCAERDSLRHERESFLEVLRVRSGRHRDELAEKDAEIELLRKAVVERDAEIKSLKVQADFGWQCYQDRTEKAFVEASVVKRLEAEKDAEIERLRRLLSHTSYDWVRVVEAKDAEIERLRKWNETTISESFKPPESETLGPE